jgi:hypothetical protein
VVQIAPDRTFSFSVATATGDLKLTMHGAFDGAGGVSGRLQGHLSLDYKETHYECDSGLVDWSGKRQ